MVHALDEWRDVMPDPSATNYVEWTFEQGAKAENAMLFEKAYNDLFVRLRRDWEQTGR